MLYKNSRQTTIFHGNNSMSKSVLIVGAGNGLSASVARRFHAAGMSIILAARNIDKLSAVQQQTDALAMVCDATSVESVESLFSELDETGCQPDTVVFNVGLYERGAFTSITPSMVKRSLMANAYSAMLVAQAAVKRMQGMGHGSIIYTGASASLKGFAESAPFAMGKFALRGLCQSLAREFSPKNIHIVHAVIDGLIYNPDRGSPYDLKDRTLNPDDIAETYFQLSIQSPSAWTSEIELRPQMEAF